MLQFIKNIIQLVFSPDWGWEDLEQECDKRFLDTRVSETADSGDFQRGATFTSQRGKWDEQVAQSTFLRCFLPFVAVCSLSELMRVVYGTADLVDAFIRAAISFMTLFLASQVGRFALQFYCPRLIDSNTDPADLRGRWFMLTIYPLAFLAIVEMLANMVKVHIALLGFLPFYVVFIIWKGWRFAGIEERNVGPFMILATASILGSAYLIDFALGRLI